MERPKLVAVAIVLGVPNVKPVAAVDAVASPLPKPNPVNGLDAKADAAVVVAAGAVPPKLKFKAVPADAGVENPAGAAVVVAPAVRPIVAGVPVPNVKPGV